jgi:hypothetical protein
VALAAAFAYNGHLLEMNVSYNALGDPGAMAFGQALATNSCLRILDLSYNNIRSKGAHVLASALSRACESTTLSTLILDGNHIGKEAGQRLMHTMCIHYDRQGSRTITTKKKGQLCLGGVFISMNACHLKDRGVASGKDFDASEPAGTYDLDLSDPYDQMIAHELLRLATFKQGCAFKHVAFRPTKETLTKNAVMIRLGPPTVNVVTKVLEMKWQQHHHHLDHNVPHRRFTNHSSVVDGNQRRSVIDSMGVQAMLNDLGLMPPRSYTGTRSSFVITCFVFIDVNRYALSTCE